MTFKSSFDASFAHQIRVLASDISIQEVLRSVSSDKRKRVALLRILGFLIDFEKDSYSVQEIYQIFNQRYGKFGLNRIRRVMTQLKKLKLVTAVAAVDIPMIRAGITYSNKVRNYGFYSINKLQRDRVYFLCVVLGLFNKILKNDQHSEDMNDSSDTEE